MSNASGLSISITLMERAEDEAGCLTTAAGREPRNAFENAEAGAAATAAAARRTRDERAMV